MARRDRGRLRDRMGETVHLTAAPPAFGARGPGAVGTQPDKPSETRYPAAGGYTDTVHGVETNVPEPSDDPAISLAYRTPTSAQRRFALGVVILQFVACAVVAPFPAHVPRIDSFVPVILAVIFVADLITAVLLFSQSSIMASRAILILANGYLFS